MIVKYLPLGKRLWSIVLGSILYRLVLVIILAMNVDAQMLKLENVQKEQGKPSSELPWATKLKGKNLMAEIQVEQVVAQMRALNLF